MQDLLKTALDVSPYIPIVVAWAPLLMGYLTYLQEYVDKRTGGKIPTEAWSVVKRSALIGVCIVMARALGCTGVEMWGVAGVSAGIVSGGYSISKVKKQKAKAEINASTNTDGIPSE
jgi:hypothetical protein